jgi:hypothetical protein
MPPKKGRGVGVPNYKNDLLINVIEAILPDGAMQWQLVATRYKEVSGEAELRDCHDLKRHFTTSKSLCDNGKKVTGSAAPKPVVARCQDIWRRILSKSSASNCGGSNSDDETSDSDEETEVYEQYEENADNEESYSAVPYGSQYNSQLDDETQFEEEDDENNELSENVDRHSGSRDLHIDATPHPFHSNAARSRILPVTAPVQRAPVRAPSPNPMTSSVASQSSRAPLRDPFAFSAQRHDGQRPPIPPVPSNRASREPSPVERPIDPTPGPGQKKRVRSESEESGTSGKSKNVRNNPRGSAGAALASLANAYTQKQAQNVPTNA